EDRRTVRSLVGVRDDPKVADILVTTTVDALAFVEGLRANDLGLELAERGANLVFALGVLGGELGRRLVDRRVDGVVTLMLGEDVERLANAGLAGVHALLAEGLVDGGSDEDLLFQSRTLLQLIDGVDDRQ